MNREEFEKAILELWQDDWYEDKANIVKEYVFQLEQQNAELQKERANMQATHQSTIESYRKEIAELQARIKELDECTDRTISQNRSLILHYENKKCTNCFHSQTDATGNILYCHKKFSKIYGKEVGWDFGCNLWEIL